MVNGIQRLTVVAATAAFALSVVNAASAWPDLSASDSRDTAGGTVVPTGHQPQPRSSDVPLAPLRERTEGAEAVPVRVELVASGSQPGGDVDLTALGLLVGVCLVVTAIGGAIVTRTGGVAHT